MCGRICLVTNRSPFTFVSIIRSQSSRSASCRKSKPLASPALLIRMSGIQPSSTNSPAALATASRSRTSTCAVRTETPVSSDSSAASASSRSWRRAQRANAQPSAASFRAHASPIPADAPVITAFRSLSIRTLSRDLKSRWAPRFADTLPDASLTWAVTRCSAPVTLSLGA